jgi:hypothetical protein
MGGLALRFGLYQETAVPELFYFFWVSYGREV